MYERMQMHTLWNCGDWDELAICHDLVVPNMQICIACVRAIVDPDPGKNYKSAISVWRPALRNAKNKYTLQSSKS